MNKIQSFISGTSPFKVTVLFTSAGRRVALIRSFRQAMEDLNIDGRIVCVDASDLSAASRISDSCHVVPRCTDTGYMDALVDICRTEHVSLLFPLIDTELWILANNADCLRRVGCAPVVSEPETISIARDKRLTAQFFQSIGITTPAVLTVEEARAKPDRFPIFLKPVGGSASVGSRILRSLEDLEYWLPRTQEPLLLQYVGGKEYTVDVYAGLDGVARCAVPRLRLEVRAGEVSKGLTVAESRVMEDALRIVKSLPGPRGVLTLQCILPEPGPPHFFEINPRFAGGVPLSIEAGANFPLWLLTEYLGKAPDIGFPGFRPHLLMLRYDDAVFFEMHKVD